MAAVGRDRELFSKRFFTVHDMSSGFESAKFQKASGLEMTVGIGEYSEGGAMAPLKEPAGVTFGNITLEYGVCDDWSFYSWCNEVVNFLAHLPEGKGLLTLDMLRNLEIRQKDRSQAVRTIFPLMWCFPARWKPGDWDNESNDVQLEELEIAIHWTYRK